MKPATSAVYSCYGDSFLPRFISLPQWRMDADIRLKLLDGIAAAVDAQLPDVELAEFVRRQVALMRSAEEALRLASELDARRDSDPRH